MLFSVADLSVHRKVLTSVCLCATSSAMYLLCAYIRISLCCKGGKRRLEKPHSPGDHTQVAIGDLQGIFSSQRSGP
ncbi:hypothetical protein F4679DRAFT_564963 [Xylaria curta]|nr:hypothetical protein F4679DRAFT_564963 [Xylaria curta]